MSVLERSLDSIIASNSTSRKLSSRGGKKSTPIGRNVGKLSRSSKSITGPKKNIKNNNSILRQLQRASSIQLAKLQKAQQASTTVSSSALNYSQKVVISGLPNDIKTEAVKEFFESQIGGIKSISLSYNSKGQPIGVATVIFKQSKSAQLAVEKYNGSPIDNGKSKLKLELVVDPSLRPLADRIVPNLVPVQPRKPVTDFKTRLQQKSRDRRNGNGNAGLRRGSRQQVVRRATPSQRQVARKNGNPGKPKKKTIEQLDQEMADYFTNGDQ